MQDELRPGCGAKAGLLIVFLIAALIVAAIYWAWSENPADVSSLQGSAAAPPVQPAN